MALGSADLPRFGNHRRRVGSLAPGADSKGVPRAAPGPTVVIAPIHWGFLKEPPEVTGEPVLVPLEEGE